MKKSSAERKHPPSLEDIFREGFEGAESVPSPRMWENLDRELENQELRRYRTQVFWYRSVAAAILVLFITAGVIYLNYQNGVASVPMNQVAAAPDKTKQPEDSAPKNDFPVAVPETKLETQEIAAVFDPFSEKQPQNVTESAPQPNVVASHFPQKASIISGPVAKLNRLEAAGETGIQIVAAEEKLVTVSEGAVQNVGFGLQAADEEAILKNKTAVVSQSTLAALTLSDSSATSSKPASLLLRKDNAALVAANAPEKKDASSEMAALSKWSVSLAYAPQYAYSPITVNENRIAGAALSNFTGESQMYGDYQKAMQEHNQSYSPGYSYNARLGASFSINEKWHLETGLLYAENMATTNHTYVINSSNESASRFTNGLAILKAEAIVQNIAPASSSEVVSVTKSQPYITQYKFQQVGLPLRIGYRHTLNKLFAFATGGVNVNMLLRSSITPKSEQLDGLQYKYGQEESPFRSWQCFSVASVGVGYEVNSKVSVRVAPEISYALTPFLKENHNQPNAFQLGLSVGSTWRLSK